MDGWPDGRPGHIMAPPPVGDGGIKRSKELLKYDTNIMHKHVQWKRNAQQVRMHECCYVQTTAIDVWNISNAVRRIMRRRGWSSTGQDASWSCWASGWSRSCWWRWCWYVQRGRWLYAPSWHAPRPSSSQAPGSAAQLYPSPEQETGRSTSCIAAAVRTCRTVQQNTASGSLSVTQWTHWNIMGHDAPSVICGHS